MPAIACSTISPGPLGMARSGERRREQRRAACPVEVRPPGLGLPRGSLARRERVLSVAAQRGDRGPGCIELPRAPHSPRGRHLRQVRLGTCEISTACAQARAADRERYTHPPGETDALRPGPCPLRNRERLDVLSSLLEDRHQVCQRVCEPTSGIGGFEHGDGLAGVSKRVVQTAGGQLEVVAHERGRQSRQRPGAWIVERSLEYRQAVLEAALAREACGRDHAHPARQEIPGRGGVIEHVRQGGNAGKVSGRHQHVRERKASRKALRGGGVGGVETVDRGTAQLDRRVEPSLPMRKLPRQQPQVGPIGVVGRQRLDPSRNGVRCGADEGWTLPRDRVRRRLPGLAREVEVDRLDRSLEFLERSRDLAGREPLLVHRRLGEEPRSEELAEQRVKLWPALGARGPHEQCVAVDGRGEALLRAEAGPLGNLQVRSHTRDQQRAPKVLVEGREYLFGEVLVREHRRWPRDGAVSSRRRQRHSERPAVRRLQQRLDRR